MVFTTFRENRMFFKENYMQNDENYLIKKDRRMISYAGKFRVTNKQTYI